MNTKRLITLFLFCSCAVLVLSAKTPLSSERSAVYIDSYPSGISLECHEYSITPGGFVESYSTLVTPCYVYPWVFFDEFGYYESYYQIIPNQPGWVFAPEAVYIYDGSPDVFFNGTNIDPPDPQMSTVYISSEPSGAEVVVNGLQMGLTPCELVITESQVFEIALSMEGWVFSPISANVFYEPYYQSVHFTGSPTVRVYSDPPGAEVTINGAWYGFTPLELMLSQGVTYDISVQLPGWNFDPQMQTVTFEDPHNVFFMGFPMESSVYVTSEPSGASVWLNDWMQFGTTPCEIMVGFNDLINVSVSLDGWSFNPSSYSVFYNQGPQSVHFGGNPIISINSSPTWADVFINGNYVGCTPYETTISPGEVFEVSVSLPGYVFNPQSQIVTYDSGPANLVFWGDFMASQVNVTSNPSGAEIFVNDGYYGTTPCLLQIPIYSSATIFVSLAGWTFDPPWQTIYPQFEPQSVCFEGTQIGNMVFITSEPPGANVLINGVLLGTTPYEYTVQEGETSYVSLELAGWTFDPPEQSVTYTSYPQTIHFFGTIIEQPESSQDWIWAKQAGGVNYDLGRSIAVDSAGNNYVTGTYWGYPASFGTTTLANSGGHDIFVAKLDANGNWLWAKRAGGSSDDISNSIAVDNNGYFYITGHFSGTASFGSFTLNSSGGQDIFVAKLDSNGNWLWAKRAGGNLNETSNSVSFDNLGSSLITGEFYGTADFGATYLTTAGGPAIFVSKLSSSGNWIWAKQTVGDGGTGKSIAADNSGNCLVTGNYYGTTSFGSEMLISNNGSSDVFIAKLSASGNWLWAKRAGGPVYDISTGIKSDNLGNSYITGSFGVDAGGNAIFGSVNLNSSGSSDIFVAKLNASGNWLWAKRAGGSGFDQSSSIYVNGLGNCYITGSYNAAYGEVASFGSNNLNGSGNSDIFAAKLDTSGSWLWAKRSSGISNEYGSDIAVDITGNSFIIGHFADYYLGGSTSFGANTITSCGNVDIFTAKLCGDSNRFLTCTIKDSAGQGIPDVEVQITGINLQYITLTDANGQFTVSNLNVNQVNIHAEKTGYESISESMLLSLGANYRTITMTGEGAQAASLALSNSLTIYADNIVQSPNRYYTLTGNVNINGVLSLPGQVIVDKRAYLVNPKILFQGAAHGLNINGASPVIVPDIQIPVIYSVIGEDLVPYDFDFFIESVEEVCGYEIEIGRITISETVSLGKYVEVMGLVKTAEENFFSKLMDWADDTLESQPPEIFMLDLEAMSVSVYYSQMAGVTYGCAISGLSYNFVAFSVKDFSLWIDPTENIFGGSLKLRIPGVGNLGSYVEPSKEMIKIPVQITDANSGKTISTNLEQVLEMSRQGIFQYLEIEAMLEFAQGQLNSLAITLSGMNIPLFSTGTFIRQIHGGVYDLAVNDLRVEATVDIGLHSSLDITGMGPVVYLNDVGAIIKPWNYLQGGGEFQVFKQTVSDGKFYYDGNKQCLGLEANVMLMMESNNPGSSILNGKLYGNINTSNLNAGMNAQIKTPDDLPWYLSWAEGLALASADVNLHNFELSMMLQLYHLSLAQKLVYGKPTFPYFHYYLGANYDTMYQIWKGTRDGRPAIDFQVPENAQQILIVAGNDTNLFDFSVSAPNGTVFNNTDPGYHQFTSTSQTILVIDNPKPGNWTFFTSQQGEITTEFKVINQAPSALVSMPATRGSRDNNIRLSMMDYSDTLNVKVYYDTDDKHFDGVFIQEFSVLNNADLEFVWHNSDLENGEYYIYTRIDDGKNAPVLQYAPGSIIVNNYYVEAPQNVTASVSNGNLHVTWNNPLGADILLTEISIQDIHNKSKYSYSIVGDNQYTIYELPTGREYLVRCRFANNEFKMSNYSSAGSIVYTNGSRNTPPYFTMDKDEVWVFVENQARTYTITAANPDGGNLSFYLLDSQGGMNIAGSTFNWTPSASQKGFYQQAIVVTNGVAADTLYQQIAVYSEEQAALKVRFSSFYLYEADRMFIKIYNIYSEEQTQSVTLTNLRSNAQITVSCRRVNKFEYIGQFLLSVNTRTEIPVMDGDEIQATYTYNGNTYTALSVYSSDPQVSDIVPPAAVTDLQATLREGNSVVLQWTATGDNGSEGRAFKYDLRYSYQPIQIIDDFLVANLYPISLYPSESGVLDTLIISLQDLGNNAQYNTVYFALVVEDTRQNRSGLSNVATLTYLTPPAQATAVSINDALVCVNWTDMFPDRNSNVSRSRTAQTRDEVDFIGYQLWRDHNGTLSLLADSLTASSYTNNITELSDGTLCYGVKAIYNSGSSGLCLSNTINLERFMDIRILCQQDSLSPAAAVQYNIVGLDSLYQHSFSGQTNSSGVILLDDVYQNSYQITLSKAGCFPSSYLIDLTNAEPELVLDIYSALPPEPLYIEIIGEHVQLSWNPVRGAINYKIYVSENPLTNEWGEPIVIQTETSLSIPIVGEKMFIRVIAGAGID